MSEISPDQMDEPVGSATSQKDTLAGDRVGVDYRDGVAHVQKDTLAGDRVGVDYRDGFAQTQKDVLVGDALGIYSRDALAVVSIDYLIKEPPFSLQNAQVDYLVDVPPEPVSIRMQANTLASNVAQWRDTPLPDTLRSPIYTLALSQLIAKNRPGVFPRSLTGAYSVRQMAATRAVFLPAQWVQSRTRVTSQRQIVAQSRVRAAPPVSEILAYQFRQLAAAPVTYPLHKTPALLAGLVELVARRRTLIKPDPEWHAQTTAQVIAVSTPSGDTPRSTETLHAVRQLVAVKRIIPSNWFAQGSAQLAASKASADFPMSAASYASSHQLAVVAAMSPPPMSQSRVAAQRQLVATKLDLSLRKSENHVAELVQLVANSVSLIPLQSLTRVSNMVSIVASAGDSTFPISQNIVRQFTRNIAAKKIVPATQRSHSIFAAMRVQYAIALPDLPIHETIRYTASLHRLSASHRDVPPPAANVGQYAATMHIMSVGVRDTLPPIVVEAYLYTNSFTQISASRRNVAPPDDVVDQTVGRHAASFSSIIATHRATVSPGEYEQSRFVMSLGVAVMVADSEFEPLPPNPPITADVDVPVVFSAALVADKAFGVAIEAMANQVVANAAMYDESLTFDAATPTATLTVPLLLARAVIGDDSFIDPYLVHADAEVGWLVARSVIAQPEFPDPSVPQSRVEVGGVAKAVAVSGTGEWPDPTIPISEMQLDNISATFAIKSNEFADPTVPASRLDVDSTMAGALVKETAFHDPYIPTSDLDITSVGVTPAVGDASMPDPTIPVSEVEADNVALAVGLRDASMPDPYAPSSDALVGAVVLNPVVTDTSMDGVAIASDAACNMLVASLLMRDASMLEIPPRAAEARPVVTIRLW